MVYQQFINYPNMNVFDNIASPLKLAERSRAEIRKHVEEVAEMLRLEPFLKRRPAELSGGQQQRCAMARALVKDSDLVLLDEPLANLDYKLREELREELPRLFAARERTVVYATTEPSEALLLGGHTAAMHEGRITQFGPTGEIYRHPVDKLTASVFSDPPINTIRVTKQGEQFAIADNGTGWDARGAYLALRDGPYEFGVRPHHVSPAADASTAHWWKARCTWPRSPAPNPRYISTCTVGPGSPWRTACTPSTSDRARVSTSTSTIPCCSRRRATWSQPWMNRRPDMARIDLKDLRHSYLPNPTGDADYALKQLDLVWDDGGAYALLGPSGCGKTTLLNIISGLLTPSEGSILFDGEDGQRQVPGGTPDRAGVPVPGRLRHDDRVRQPRLSAAQPRCSGEAGRRPRACDRRHDRPRRTC